MTVFWTAGDVAVALFPYSDLSLAPARPALVLSTGEFAELTGNTVLAMITTGLRSTWPFDTRLQDHESAGLRVSSVVRMRLATVANARVASRLGRLSEADCANVSAAFARAFPL